MYWPKRLKSSLTLEIAVRFIVPPSLTQTEDRIFFSGCSFWTDSYDFDANKVYVEYFNNYNNKSITKQLKARKERDNYYTIPGFNITSFLEVGQYRCYVFDENVMRKTVYSSYSSVSLNITGKNTITLRVGVNLIFSVIPTKNSVCN